MNTKLFSLVVWTIVLSAVDQNSGANPTAVHYSIVPTVDSKTKCTPYTDSRQMAECDFTNSSKFCYKDSTCNCLSLSRLAADGFAMDFDISSYGISIEMTYDPTAKKCQSTIGSACPLGQVSLPAYPIPRTNLRLEDLNPAINNVACANNAVCQSTGHELVDMMYIGKCVRKADVKPKVINDPCAFTPSKLDLSQCDFDKTFLVCYKDSKCGCPSLSRLSSENILPIDTGSIPVTIETEYNEEKKVCQSKVDSLCPLGPVSIPPDIPDISIDLHRLSIFANGVTCKDNGKCKSTKNEAMDTFHIGKCTGTSIFAMSQVVLLLSISFLCTNLYSSLL